MLNAAVIADATIDDTGTFAASLTLKDGANAIGLTLLSGKDVIARSAYTVILDRQPPTLDVIGPVDNSTVDGMRCSAASRRTARPLPTDPVRTSLLTPLRSAAIADSTCSSSTVRRSVGRPAW